MILILKTAFLIFAFGLFQWNVPYLHKSFSLGGSLPLNDGISHVLRRVEEFRAKLLFGSYSELAPVVKDLNDSSACLTPEEAEDFPFLATENSSVPEGFPEEEWKTEVLPEEHALPVFNESSFHNCSAGEAEEEWKTEVLPEEYPLPGFKESSFHNCSAGEAEEYVFGSENLQSLWKDLAIALGAVLFVTYPVMFYWICPQPKTLDDFIAEEPESPLWPQTLKDDGTCHHEDKEKVVILATPLDAPKTELLNNPAVNIPARTEDTEEESEVQEEMLTTPIVASNEVQPLKTELFDSPAMDIPARSEDAEEESEVRPEILTASDVDDPILVADETIGVLNQCVKKKKLVKGKFYFMMKMSESNCLSAEVLDNIIEKHKGAIDVTTSFHRDRIYFTCATVEDEDRLPSIVEEIRLSIQKFRIQI